MSPKSELNIYRPIEEAVSVANKIKGDFLKNNLDLVLYTGGASNMAGVKAALKSYFAPVRCYSISEEDACNTVALGAACCRYEEIHNIRKITMTSRLLESLFTRKPGDKNYTLLVPLQCEPSETFKKVEGNFELLRPTINLKLPLFRGTSTRDHQLSPMRDIEFPLSQIIDGDVKYSIFYRMTMNKTIELKVEFETINGPIEAIASVDLLLDTSGKTRPFELCKINPV